MPLELWIPESATPEPRQVFQCTLCGLKLPREQRAQFRRHVMACLKKNGDKIEAEIAKRNANAFTSALDPEREKWIREQEENPLRDVNEEFYNRNGVME